ncbi:MAG: 50S ribosomal protein L24e [Nanoarchaeota archaeon]|nr:50S ribosomal protein L24e [Nanoarchaeota archaeon]
MVKCDFCGLEISRGTGKMYVKKDGRIFNLCSMKCEKNLFKLGRVPRYVKWTQSARALKAKTLSEKAAKEEKQSHQ